MNRTALVSRLFLAMIPTVAMALCAAGCESNKVGDAGDQGDEADTCEEYTGDGCTPDEERECSVDIGEGTPVTGIDVCEVVEGCKTAWNYGCNTPLVLSFDGAEPEMAADAMSGFDVNGRASQVTDWPTAKTPWLALDRDGSGSIEDGAELFGSMSPLSSGTKARNGFLALRELDENGDGRITAEDARFGELLVWADGDGDRQSGSSELRSATAWEIVAIDLAYTSEPVCDARGNCGVERAPFQYRDASGAVRSGTVIDVRLPPQ